MEKKRALIVEDMCVVGQCSLSVALPVLSACGAEVCALPVSLLSTHSVGFEGYTRLSLADEAERIVKHFLSSGITFDAVMCGYLGGVKEARLVHLANRALKEGGLRIVDPAVGDFGTLYPDLSGEALQEVRTLCVGADAILPNFTEACLLAGREHMECSLALARELAEHIKEEYSAGAVVVTGVEDGGRIGALAVCGERTQYFGHKREDRVCHGAGDVFASAFEGAMLCGADAMTAVELAEAFVYDCIKHSLADREHWYGLNFEPLISTLPTRIEEALKNSRR